MLYINHYKRKERSVRKTKRTLHIRKSNQRHWNTKQSEQYHKRTISEDECEKFLKDKDIWDQDKQRERDPHIRNVYEHKEIADLQLRKKSQTNTKYQMCLLNTLENT